MNTFLAVICIVILYLVGQVIWRYRHYLFADGVRHVPPIALGTMILLAKSWHHFYTGANTFEDWTGWAVLFAYALFLYGLWYAPKGPRKPTK